MKPRFRLYYQRKYTYRDFLKGLNHKEGLFSSAQLSYSVNSSFSDLCVQAWGSRPAHLCTISSSVLAETLRLCHLQTPPAPFSSLGPARQLTSFFS